MNTLNTVWFSLLIWSGSCMFDPRVYPFSLSQAGIRNYRSLDWYEARGPLDQCRRNAFVVDKLAGGDETVLGNRRGSLITVCNKASPGDEKCICARRVDSPEKYKLECGMCIDPCAMQFVPMDTFVNDRSGASMSKEDKMDLKARLMERFLKDIIKDD